MLYLPTGRSGLNHQLCPNIPLLTYRYTGEQERGMDWMQMDVFVCQ